MSEQNTDEVFSPYAPITDKNFCYGRKREIKQIEESIFARGKHIVLFGERGSGKTSLANIAYQKLDKALTIPIVCSQLIDTPDRIWETVLEHLIIQIENNSHFSKLGSSLELIQKTLAKKQFKLNHLTFLFNQLKYPILIVLDEVDLLVKKDNLISLAETIKAFSDQVPNITLLLIGIANNANELIAKHISLERCLIEIKLNRMNADELKDILEGGLIKLKLNMLEEVKQAIIHFSEGLPFYIHLLAKETLEQAQKLKYKTAVKSNLQSALKKIIQDRSHSLEFNYHKAIVYSKNGFYEKILDACVDYCEHSTAQTKPFGVKDIVPLLIKKEGKCNERTVQNYLNKICDPSKGEILSKISLPTGTQFTFKNPLIKTFIRDMINL